ncbi:MAG: DUF3754 domain-containing protein, partial [Cyanothece sp. SIO2G6]|nr:DUF3754 domain-containing protein [Cyanothece sp. SIO2G6]
MQQNFIEHFSHLLDKSNYLELSKGTLRRALEERSLLALQTDVNLNDFQTFSCYYRGDVQQQIEYKNWLWQKKTKMIDIFERVVLLIQFKDASYFTAKKVDPATLNYVPGKIYLYFYRDVPKYDLELLFPNVRISMTWKDRLMLLVPAIGAGVAIVLRVLPQLLIILVAVLVILNVEPDKIPNFLPPTDSRGLAALVATLSMSVTLGGFAFKQYTTYKNKKIQFQKNVTDTLFFRSIANHSAVFQLLIDVAEEEECKEVILAYFHLLMSDQPLSTQNLDHVVEQWMKQRMGINVDFDIQDALDKLQHLKVMMDDGQRRALVEKVMLAESEPGQPGQSDRLPKYRALPLPLAKEIIDRLWDNAFTYNNCEN